jgi:hypothetical protein
MSVSPLCSFKSLLFGMALFGSLAALPAGAAMAQSGSESMNNPPPQNLAARQTTAASSAAPIASPAAPSAAPAALRGPEQRVALVIGNSNYRNAARLENPDHDAQSMAQFLNSAGFEVIAATDLTQNDMIKVLQDFSAKVSERGPNTVAMIYYAGHGVQLAGENYLVPIDARVTTPSDLLDNSVRLVDVMATLEAIPSRMRIVVLDACRNNPFPTINDAGRGLAIVDAPNGSIVGYSTAPGTEALDGDAGHSPYAAAFLRLASEPNLPIEQLFKRIRLEVNRATDGQQTPWESSSLTSDFYFFGDTAVAATHAPARARATQTASNLPWRSVRQVYDYVVTEGSPEYYQEFIQLFPNDPLCDRIRVLLSNLSQAEDWHQAVLINSPFAYKAFHDHHPDSPYALTALHLQSQPRSVPVMQPTHILAPDHLFSQLRFGNGGGKPGDAFRMDHGRDAATGAGGKPTGMMPGSDPGKVVTLPAPGNHATVSTDGGNTGKIVTLPVTTNGKTGLDHDAKGTGAPNRIVDHPVDRPQLFHNDSHGPDQPKFNRDRQTFAPGQGSGTMAFNAGPHVSSSTGGGSFNGGFGGGFGGGGHHFH